MGGLVPMPALTNYLAEIVRRTFQIGDEIVLEGAHFVTDLGADSLDCVELMMEIEDVFTFEFPDDDLPNLTTLGSVASYLRDRVSEIPAISSVTVAFPTSDEMVA